MKAVAVVYTSNTGFTQKYANMISDKLGLPVFSFKEAKQNLKKQTKIVYIGWLFANAVKGFKKANKRFDICAVCGVGLCDTGALVQEVRNRTHLNDNTPLFTLQGGIDKTKLKGLNKLLINMLIKALKAQKNPSETDKHMLNLLSKDADYVNIENLSQFFKAYQE